MVNKKAVTINEAEVIKRYKDGESPYQIAEFYSTYANKIRRILKKNQVEIRSKSEAQKSALKQGRSAHPTEGKERTEAEKIAISSSMISYWDNISDEEREKRSAIAKEQWNKLSDKEKHEMTQRGMRAIKKASTEGSKLERFVREFLQENNYNVESHVKNLIPKDKLEIDLYIRKLKLIIEIDGPSHFLPIWGDDRFSKQVASDLRKSGTLLSKGFVVIRVKAINNVSISRTKKLNDRILEIVQEVAKKRPPESKCFIEVEY